MRIVPRVARSVLLFVLPKLSERRILRQRRRVYHDGSAMRLSQRCLTPFTPLTSRALLFKARLRTRETREPDG